MSLIVPGSPGFTFCVDTNTGSPGAVLPGVTFASPGTNVDGAVVTLFTALARDVCNLVIHLGGTAAAANNNATLVDILIDPAGGTSWASLIDDLVCGGDSTTAVTRGYTGYSFPIWIPAGASVGLRARTARSSALSGRAMAWAYGEPRRPELWWCGQGVESLGINAASSKGTTHTPGVVGAYSAWATIGTSTRRYGALQFGINVTDAIQNSAGYYWQMGVGGAQLPGSPTLYNVNDTNEVIARYGFGQPLFCDLPAGTALQCRAQCSSGTTEDHDVAYYGVY